MNLNLVYDSSVNTAPSGFTSALNDLVSFFQSTFQDPVTVNIAIGYGEIAGQALDAGALGESSALYNIFSYAQLRSAFASDVKSADDASAVASLPTDAPVGGNFWVTRGEAKALALINPASTKLDGYVGFNASTNIFDYDTGNGVSKGQYDFYAVAAHEISEIMGRQLMDGGGSGTSYEPMDLFHYAGPENRIFVGYQAGYFSPDDGATNLGDFNTIQGGDLGDWASSVGRDAFRAFSGSGVVNPITQNDVRVMDVLGWDLAGATNPNADTTPPLRVALVATSPADNATQVAPGAYIVLTFNEAVHAGSGNIVIQASADGAPVATMAAGDSSQVIFSGNTVTIDPAGDLALGTGYYVTLAPGVISDSAGNPFAGISSPADLNFTTAAVDHRVASDFDHSGTSDILWRSDSGVISIWEMNSSNVVRANVVPGGEAIAQAWTICGIGDFNADGKSDILWRNDNGAVAIWEMNGTSLQYGAVVPGAEAILPSWQIAGTGDFNADGISDILWRNTDSGAVAIWEMNGTSLQYGKIIPGAEAILPSWQIAGTGDFNADGMSDILWRNTDSGAVAIWEMNGTSLQYGKIIPGAEAILPSWQIAGTGDFNADGMSDILWRNTDSGAVAIWEMNGTSLQYGKIIPGAEAILPSWQIAGTGDFNVDGMSDILWRNDSGGVAIWEMNGASLQNGAVIPGAEAIPQSWHIEGYGLLLS